MSNYRGLKIPELKNLIKEKGGMKSRYSKKDDLIKYLMALEKSEKCDKEKECSDNGKCIVEDKGLPGLCIPESLNNAKNQTESYTFNGRTFYGTKQAIKKLTEILRQPSPHRQPSPSPRRQPSPSPRRQPSPSPSPRRQPSPDLQILDYIKKFGGENTEMINKNDLVSFINNAMKGNRCEPENDRFCGDGQSCDIAYSPGICVPKDDADKMSKYPGIKFFDINGNNIHGPQSSINRMRQMREQNFPDEEEKYPEDSDDDLDGQVITDIDPFASSPPRSIRTRTSDISIARTVQSSPKSSPRGAQQSRVSPRASPRVSSRVSSRASPRVSPRVSPRASPRASPRSAPRSAQPSRRNTPAISPSNVQSMLSQLQQDNISSIDELSETNKQVLKCLGLLG